MAEIYDPLSYNNLARSVVNALLSADREPLPPDQFDGSGVYAIYYNGALDYVSDDSLTETPVYVGKAVPPGARERRSEYRADDEQESLPAIAPTRQFQSNRRPI